MEAGNQLLMQQPVTVANTCKSIKVCFLPVYSPLYYAYILKNL